MHSRKDFVFSNFTFLLLNNSVFCMVMVQRAYYICLIVLYLHAFSRLYQAICYNHHELLAMQFLEHCISSISCNNIINYI